MLFQTNVIFSLRQKLRYRVDNILNDIIFLYQTTSCSERSQSYQHSTHIICTHVKRTVTCLTVTS